MQARRQTSHWNPSGKNLLELSASLASKTKEYAACNKQL